MGGKENTPVSYIPPAVILPLSHFDSPMANFNLFPLEWRGAECPPFPLEWRGAECLPFRCPQRVSGDDTTVNRLKPFNQ